MQIIVEYVLLDNFLIDALLLYLTNKIIKQPISKLGLVTASAFGAGFAVLSPIIPVAGIWAILIKFAIAGIMVFMLNFTFHKFFIKYLLFVGLTFAFGGSLIAIFNFLGIGVYDSLYIGYISSLPIGTILVSGVVFLWLGVRSIKAIFKFRQYNEQTCEITIVANEKSATLTGFVDSGNVLHNSSGKSVVVINEDTLKYWFSPFERMQIMLGKDSFLENSESINVSSLGGMYTIRVFDCKVSVLGVEKDGALGVAPSKIRYGKCNAIVGKELLEV